MLLNKALKYARDFESKSAKSPNPEVPQIKILVPFLAQLQTLLKLHPSLPLCQLLPSVEAGTVIATESAVVLPQTSALFRAKEEIQNLLRDEQALASKFEEKKRFFFVSSFEFVESGQVLQTIISSLKKEAVQPKMIPYFSRFLNYIVLLAQILSFEYKIDYFSWC